ncbi:hypothetical protein LUZ60_010811 [Juncus effusus]|nr:hypothetical protein LUZ60_010811 [Juncus effusus]
MELNTNPWKLRLTFFSPFIPPFPFTNPNLSKKLVFKIDSKRKRNHDSVPKIPITDEGLSRILRTEAAVLGIARKAHAAAALPAGKSRRRLWPRSVLQALEEAISSNSWQSALQIFALLRNQHWYKPKSQTYARLITMLGKSNRPNEAQKLFQIMKSEKFKPSIDIYTSLVGTLSRTGLLEEAIRTVEEMKTILDCTPDEFTYTILINGCMKHKKFDKIPYLLSEMSYLGLEINIVTYNSIIDGFGKAGLLNEMEIFISNMLEEGKVVPDLFTMNSVLWAFGNKNKINEMEKWYGEFLVIGIEPDVQTFNILIKSYGKYGLYDRMINVLKYMKKRFYSPTVVTYNIIIECFGRNLEIEKMEYNFRVMKIKGIKPNSVTYCSLINSYSKAGLMYKISGILRQIENTDVALDTTFFNCLINAYGKNGDIKIMEEMFELMKEKNCKPDKITYETMIRVYNSCDMIFEAKILESKLVENEIKNKLTIKD